jgi:diguanylate cyclase (GGDEF)-like protein
MEVMSDGARDPLLAALILATPELAAVLDADRRPTFVNGGFTAAWPGTEALRVDDALELVHPEDRPRVSAAFALLEHADGRTATVDARIGWGGTWWPVRARLTDLHGDAAVGGTLVHLRELTGGRRPGPAEASGEDPLTGLPDRSRLLERLDAYREQLQPGVLLICDLDHFRLVNESLGHAAGDEVLVAVGALLEQAVHEGDLVARLGGDEFAVLCPHVGRRADELPAALRAALRPPAGLDHTGHDVTASIGVSPLSPGGSTIEILAAAKTAVYVAKRQGRDRTEVLDTGQQETAATTRQRTAELRQAARDGELSLRYQPIMDLPTGSMVGCEALLRWDHPREGTLPATTFIAMAESSGLDAELTDLLLEQACQAARLLKDGSSGGAAPYVAMNLSPRQLSDRTLVRRVEAAADTAGIEPCQLMVEVTETTLMNDEVATTETLEALRALGLGVALDDFGTGFSSLLHLRRLPVTQLKVDRSFVSEILRSSDDLAIVASTIHLATTLGLTAVAEGVETEEQAGLLGTLGCHRGQGFLWSPAVPLAELVSWAGDRAGPGTEPAVTGLTDPVSHARIMQMHRSGASLNTIAAALNNTGERTLRGTRWHPRSVARVIARAAFPDLPART